MKINQIAAFLLLFIVSGLFWAGWFGQGGVKQIRNNLQEYNDLVEQIDNIHQENVKLQNEIEYFTDDKFWLEKQIREKLGWVKPDEVIYKFKANEK
ncbi:MAG: septum formation initiator family protein [Candidatus Schekmanbacteria bacterium]|nr:septum formation initiator family protein [Candidatus Schekmanbacteria bacterium]